MRHQQAILGQRIINLQEGIKQADKYLNAIDKMLYGKESISAEEISTVRDEIDELQSFLGWLGQQ